MGGQQGRHPHVSASGGRWTCTATSQGPRRQHRCRLGVPLTLPALCRTCYARCAAVRRRRCCWRHAWPSSRCVGLWGACERVEQGARAAAAQRARSGSSSGCIASAPAAGSGAPGRARAWHAAVRQLNSLNACTLQGKPIMSDAEYDALKQSLGGSSVYQLEREGPVCTLGKPGEKGQKQGEAQTDYSKMLLLTVPPALAVSSPALGQRRVQRRAWRRARRRRARCAAPTPPRPPPTPAGRRGAHRRGRAAGRAADAHPGRDRRGGVVRHHLACRLRGGLHHCQPAVQGCAHPQGAPLPRAVCRLGGRVEGAARGVRHMRGGTRAASLSATPARPAPPPQAACPNCGEVQNTYFGDILTVAGALACFGLRRRRRLRLGLRCARAARCACAGMLAPHALVP